MSGNVVRGDMVAGDKICGNSQSMNMNGVSKGIVRVNGISYDIPAGVKNITVKNGKIYFDGKEFQAKEKYVAAEIHIENVDSLNGEFDGNISIDKVEKCDKIISTSGDITVKGNVGSVKTVSGDVSISGNVTGTINTVSGDVTR